jgi:cobalt/nickel transport system permease protein
MLPGLLGPLFAVHISDGILQGTWLASGFVLAGLFAILALWRLRDEEIPRIALLTAAFFVASSIHVRVGPTSWHLLLNGLIGVLLGWRAGLAIPIGLTLQYFLLAHGGGTTLGINTCVMLLPALLAWAAFRVLSTAPWLRSWWFRAGLVAFSTLILILSVVYSITLLVSNHLITDRPEIGTADSITFHPITLAGAVILAAVAAWLESRLRTTPEFALGLVVGELAVLATIALNYLVLVYGGDQVDLRLPARVMLVLHLPIAVIEGLVLGFAVSFLARVKPELLGWSRSHEKEVHMLPADGSAAGRNGDTAGVVDGFSGRGAHPVRPAQIPAGQPDSSPGVLSEGRPSR